MDPSLIKLKHTTYGILISQRFFYTLRILLNTLDNNSWHITWNDLDRMLSKTESNINRIKGSIDVQLNK